MNEKVLDRLQGDMLRHKSSPDAELVNVNLHVDRMLLNLAEMAADKLGGSVDRILEILLESMVQGQLSTVAREVIGPPKPSKDTRDLQEEMKGRLQNTGIEDTLSQFTSRMEELQKLVGGFQAMADSMQNLEVADDADQSPNGDPNKVPG